MLGRGAAPVEVDYPPAVLPAVSTQPVNRGERGLAIAPDVGWFSLDGALFSDGEALFPDDGGSLGEEGPTGGGDPASTGAVAQLCGASVGVRHSVCVVPLFGTSTEMRSTPGASCSVLGSTLVPSTSRRQPLG